MNKTATRIEVIDDTMAEFLRQMTPAQRLASANGMWVYARRRIEAQLTHEHPDWDVKEISAETSRRLLGSN
jgi:hypothetical protein